MGVPTRRGTLVSRDRPPNHLIHLLSTLTARELERENSNREMDRLLHQQTVMEKMLCRRFRTEDSIQEYCQYTTRDECPMANPHLHRRSRSSSVSSDNDPMGTDDDDPLRRKRKRDDPIDGNAPVKRSSRYPWKNGRSTSTCGKVHFRRLIKSHTDSSLGDCSFLNTCFHMVREQSHRIRDALRCPSPFV